MNSRRPFTTTDRRRGTTLLEIGVTSAIFLAMSTVLIALLMQNNRSAEKVTSHTDVSSEMTILFEKVRNEVRQSRVFGVDADGSLRYWKLRVVNDIPQLDADGTPDWLPGAPLAPDVALLKAEAGVLVRSFQGRRQVLARLGRDATLKFAWDAGDHTLTVSGTLGGGDAHNAVRNNVQVFKYHMYVGTSD